MATRPSAAGFPPSLRAGLRLPVIVAPMFRVSGIDLVGAACNAGVIGALPAANARSAAGLAEWLAEIDGRRAPDAAAMAVNLNLLPGRYADLDAMVDVCATRRVPLIISSVGDPARIVAQAHEWGGHVFHDVVNMRHARKAAAAGVDGLILVCAGAGGHSGALSPFSFLRAVRHFYDGAIVLAGGIADGWGIAGAQALGADAVYMGTRFIATREAAAEEDYKRMLADVDMADIHYTEAVSGLPANFMRRSVAAAGVDPAALPPAGSGAKPALPEGVRAWKHIWSAGHAVGLIDDAPPVADLVARLDREYRAAIGQVCNAASATTPV